MSRNSAIVLLIVASAIIAIAALPFTAQPAPDWQKTEPIIIGTSPFEVSGLIFIAEDRGFFRQNGLEPEIRMYEAGILAVDALYAGDVDVATASDFVFARQGLEKMHVRGIASIGTSEFHYIIARRDRDIVHFSDLRGKTIGVTRGTSGDFFLGRYLDLHGMGQQDVRIVDIAAVGIADSLAEGKVDAVSTWDPYAYSTETRSGGNVTVWPDQSGQLMYWIALCREGSEVRDRGKVTRFLSGLIEAEKFALDHPDEAEAIVRARLSSGDEYMQRVWPNTRLSLSLDRSLIAAMEDEARWMIRNNLTNATGMPDFREFLYTEGLEGAKPGSVNIIR